MACLAAITEYPVIFSAAAAKKSVQAFIAETLGVSKSYVGKGGLAKMKPKRLAKALNHGREVALAHALKGGWSLEEFEASQQDIPRLMNGDVGLTAAWVHSFQAMAAAPLPLTIALALEQDELVDVLVRAANEDDPSSFKDAIVEAIVDSHLEQPASSDPASLSAWERAEGWDEIAEIFVDVTQELMINVSAALDAEWSARYFRGFEPQSTFLWLAPRSNPVAVGTPAGTHRNQVFRPIRRLLEFSYALVERGYLGVWPDGPVGRKELAWALGTAESVVGNLFDGTRRLSFNEYASFWERMCQQPRYQAKREGMMAIPAVLARIALGWESTFVETGPGMKFKSALLIDEADFLGRCQSFRTLWASELTTGGGVEGARETWPGWLTSQSILSSTEAA